MPGSTILAAAVCLVIAAPVYGRLTNRADLDIRRSAHTINLECPFGSISHPGGDCDDTNAAIHPGQVEIVGNGIDDNCNGLADEAANGDPSTDTSDADSDNVTLESGDCNDHNPSIHPGAVEIVGDLIDNNCNGLADEDADGHPSNDTVDHDGDGVAMAPDLIFTDGFEG
jgi:hypothetical protein